MNGDSMQKPITAVLPGRVNAVHAQITATGAAKAPRNMPRYAKVGLKGRVAMGSLGPLLESSRTLRLTMHDGERRGRGHEHEDHQPGDGDQHNCPGRARPA